MEPLTGLLLLGFVMGRASATLTVEDEEGKRKELEFRGRYSRHELDEYKNKRIDIEYDWGDEGERKNLKISFHTPISRIL